jgi:hypothetical protein
MITLVNSDDFDHESHHKQLLCPLVDRKQMLTLARLTKEGKFFCTLSGCHRDTLYVCAPTELSRII